MTQAPIGDGLSDDVCTDAINRAPRELYANIDGCVAPAIVAAAVDKQPRWCCVGRIVSVFPDVLARVPAQYRHVGLRALDMQGACRLNGHFAHLVVR